MLLCFHDDAVRPGTASNTHPQIKHLSLKVKVLEVVYFPIMPLSVCEREPAETLLLVEDEQPASVTLELMKANRSVKPCD